MTKEMYDETDVAGSGSAGIDEAAAQPAYADHYAREMDETRRRWAMSFAIDIAKAGGTGGTATHRCIKAAQEIEAYLKGDSN
jgi:hypothetical protein